MPDWVWLIPLGSVVGAVGTLIGAGGGFVLVPVLLLAYPTLPSEAVTSVTLAVVFFNAFSGTCAYARLRLIDYRSGMIFAAATIPGAVLGALCTALIPRRVFDTLFGGLLVTIAAGLLVRPRRQIPLGEGGTACGLDAYTIVDAAGKVHTLVSRPYLGVGVSLFVGFLSSLLGIGGGIIHVPALVNLLGFPAHVAAATSHFILTFTSSGGTVVHIAKGEFATCAVMTLCLAMGALPGAQLGAWLAQRLHGVWIIRCLALALGSVGLRILLKPF